MSRVNSAAGVLRTGPTSVSVDTKGRKRTAGWNALDIVLSCAREYKSIAVSGGCLSRGVAGRRSISQPENMTGPQTDEVFFDE